MRSTELVRDFPTILPLLVKGTAVVTVTGPALAAGAPLWILEVIIT